MLEAATAKRGPKSARYFPISVFRKLEIYQSSQNRRGNTAFMMVWLICLLCVLAAWHFIIQGIIAPSARATVRLRLFEVRDQLRRLVADGSVQEKEFDDAQRKINNLIRLAPIVDPYMLIEWEMRMKSDKEFAARIERRWNEFESTASKEVKDLVSSACKIGAEAIRINSLGWVIYIFPIAIGVIIFYSLPQKIINMATATETEFSSSVACPA